MQPFRELNLDRRLDATLLGDRYDILLYIFFAFPSLGYDWFTLRDPPLY